MLVSEDSTGARTHPFRPPWPVPGAIVGEGRYRLLSEVGRDGRCAVRLWQGHDLLLDRNVALTLFVAAAHDGEAVGLVGAAFGRALRGARLEAAGAARVLDVLEPEDGDGRIVGVVVAEWTPGVSLVGSSPAGCYHRLWRPVFWSRWRRGRRRTRRRSGPGV